MQLILDIQNVVEKCAADAAIPAQSEIECWVTKTLEMSPYEKLGAELTVRIVEPQESQQLNLQYRHKDRPTNVLSFPFEAPPQIPCDLLGDLVICHQIVVDEAKIQNKNLSNHWAHMIVHGTLHLLGYDHLDAQEADEMEALEIEILNTLGCPNPYLAD